MMKAQRVAGGTQPLPQSPNLDRSPAQVTFPWRDGAEEHVPILEVLIVHEDLPTGLRAKQVLDRLDGEPDIKLQFVVKLWTFRVLRDPVLHEHAIRDAGSAHILFLSLHGGCELPPAVCQLIESWLADGKEQPRALVVSLDETLRESAGANPALDYLRTKAVAGGADLFPCFGPTPPTAWDWASRGDCRSRSAAGQSLPGLQLPARDVHRKGTQPAATQK